MFKILNFTRVSISIFIILLFSSCHSKYIVLKNDICRNPVWNNEKTAIAFIALQKGSSPPVGIAKFPDGGTTKSVYSNLVLFLYDVNSGKLKKLLEFPDLIDKFYTPQRDTYRVKLVYIDSIIYYNIDLLNWHSIDSITQIKYSKLYSFNINTKKNTEIDSSFFFSKYKKTNTISFNNINPILSKISTIEWGFILKDIYPISNNEANKYLIYKKGNTLMRDCVFEQIASNYTEKDIEKILNKMEHHKEKLKEKYKNNNDGPYQESLKHKEYIEYVNYIKEATSKLKNKH